MTHGSLFSLEEMYRVMDVLEVEHKVTTDVGTYELVRFVVYSSSFTDDSVTGKVDLTLVDEDGFEVQVTLFDVVPSPEHLDDGEYVKSYLIPRIREGIEKAVTVSSYQNRLLSLAGRKRWRIAGMKYLLDVIQRTSHLETAVGNFQIAKTSYEVSACERYASGIVDLVVVSEEGVEFEVRLEDVMWSPEYPEEDDYLREYILPRLRDAVLNVVPRWGLT